MTSADLPPYGEIPDRIREEADRLRTHADPEVRMSAERLEGWTAAFNRAGLDRLLSMILAWRGEIFLDAVQRDEIASVFLAHYGHGPEFH